MHRASTGDLLLPAKLEGGCTLGWLLFVVPCIAPFLQMKYAEQEEFAVM